MAQATHAGGVIEIAAGIGVAIKPKIFAYAVSACGRSKRCCGGWSASPAGCG
jgi:hypothetical protein